jgi:hypothetical protein
VNIKVNGFDKNEKSAIKLSKIKESYENSVNELTQRIYNLKTELRENNINTDLVFNTNKQNKLEIECKRSKNQTVIFDKNILEKNINDVKLI